MVVMMPWPSMSCCLHLHCAGTHNVPTLSHIRRPDEGDIRLGLMGQQTGSLGKTVTV